jgi:PAS domain S-box-containing protein
VKATVSVLHVVEVVAYVALAVAALAQWRRRRSEAAKWLAATFGVIGAVVLFGGLIPTTGHALAVEAFRRLSICGLLLFPYLLYRFTTAFGTRRTTEMRVASAITAAMLAVTIAVPKLPVKNEARPTWFSVYVLAVVIYWTALSLLVTVRLWRAGRDQPQLARRRMRMLSLGSATLNLALIVAAATPRRGSNALQVGAEALAIVATVLFGVGFAPPAPVLAIWRRREFTAFREAQARLVEASTLHELTSGLLPPLADLVGARAVVLTDASGAVLGLHGDGEPDVGAALTEATSVPTIPPAGAALPSGAYVLPVRDGRLVVLLNAYMPIFGSEEIQLLRDLARFAELAIDRVSLFERERDARVALERAIGERDRSEESFRLLVDGIRDYAMFMVDPDGKVASWNRGAERMKGYTASEIIGRPFSVFYTPEDREAGVPEAMLAAARQTGRSAVEGWRVRRDGSRFWADVVITALTDNDGRLWGFAKITRDVTERRAAQEALRESEARFRGSFEAASIGMALVGPDGAFLQVNQALTDLLASSAAELRTRTFVDLVHPDDRAAALADLAAMRTGRAESRQTEMRFVRTGGAVLWVLHTAAPVYSDDGTLRYFTSQLHDITERKLRDEARLQLAVDAVGMGTWDWDLETNEAKWSAAHVRLLGLPEDAQGSYDAFQEAVHPDDRADVVQAIELALATGGSYEQEFRVVWPDGSVHWLLGKGLVLHGPDGAPRRMVGVIHDTTARRTAEAEQARLLVLEQQTAERAVRMQRITAALSEALTTADVINVMDEQAPALLDADGEWMLALVDDDALEVVRVDDRMSALLPLGARIPLGADVPMSHAVNTKEPMYLTIDDVEARYPDRTERFRLFDREAWVLLPLVASGQAVGIWMLAFATAREFSADERAFMASVAGQCAQTLERARLFEQERTIAETLQRSLLPERLPDTPGVAAAARYEAGGPGVEVGGDWYDVIPLPDGRVAVVIGDVVGHGIRAATVMGQLRSAVRAYALEGHEPATVLANCNRVVSALGLDHMATALYAIVDPATGEIRHASAGHPPALVAGPSGSRFLEGGRGLPLGVSPHAFFTEGRAVLEPDAALIGFTDGLVEVRGQPISKGLDRLAAAAADAAVSSGGDLEVLCDTILARLHRPQHDDDTAVVALRLVSERSPVFSLVMPADFEELAPLRRRLAAWLTGSGVSDDDREWIVLSACEAATNAIEHGYGPVDANVDIRGHFEDDQVCISVRDQGSWREPRGIDRGRGLMLIEALMDRTQVRRTDHGTEVTMWRRVELDRQAAAQT